MKNFKLYISALAVMAFATSCKKSFLDEQPNQVVTTVQESAEVKKDPSLLDARISGLYTTMYEDGTGGTTNHDDFGQKGYDIYSDMLSGDMALSALTYGWYGGIEKRTDTKNAVANGDYEPWRYYYRVIYAANTVIDILGGNNATLSNSDLKHYMGQAKAMRAYAYFYLANLYQYNGYGDGTEKVLPILTSATDDSKPASTSAQVYTQIIGDLNDAITLLGDYTRPDKGHIDVNVAKGLLAYALAARGTNADLQQVETLTSDVLAKYPLTTAQQVVSNFTGANSATNAGSGFNNLATPSWIWGADITLSSGLDLVSWWGQVDVFTYSYAWVGDAKVIDQNLLAAMKDTQHSGVGGVTPDIRQYQFVSNSRGLIPINKFFDPGRTIGGQRNITTDYIYMRADEMELLNAEAHVRLGDDPGARTALKALLANRYLTSAGYAYIDGLSGSALANEVYLQTRMELWGEGKSYLSLKRNKLSVTKGPNHKLTLDQIGVTIPYNDPGITFVTPSAEYLYNSNLHK
ncbi:RagB/SusD family nutrient uptake outer membrane protein [Mucilaginibacter ximonensis]|uniref:RagB/SusD family nutrient uptake outer membrane protein n=1 Tax=Mucilaginibacter ximonensis TaxID=538021 RepID=A0ABW5YBM0_9SPHI